MKTGDQARMSRRPFVSGIGSPELLAVSIHNRNASCALPREDSCGRVGAGGLCGQPATGHEHGGNDLRLDEGIGVCGKEGQSVPVGVGISTIKIDG